jgi:hypothetical protein
LAAKVYILSLSDTKNISIYSFKKEVIMPRFDRTGPESLGSRTGRGLGKCNPDNQKTNEPTDTRESPAASGRKLGRGMARGFGFGRGAGKGHGKRFGRGNA